MTSGNTIVEKDADNDGKECETDIDDGDDKFLNDALNGDDDDDVGDVDVGSEFDVFDI
eukprot:CAMPEP_0114344742 /NCGR_PEP_ID=MMETSP0101-20121206/11660_1 /TAXON_ID=38822 ORGANISM="Pteridomonas danica, Strain PT" /NCGR_SAMPLE_ID=MMETSP0101 /ASSEMBLY_ACC=CAM_ASM_000211 /LENGTH=57 /DNA_ID=CAMNT_0001480267 /DNA_START=435 /DNA_END=608 /DNA_ORIENTATION=-